MRYPDSDGEYNNLFFLDFSHTIVRYFWVGLDLFCPSACFRRSRGYDEVAPRCRQRLRSSSFTGLQIFFLLLLHNLSKSRLFHNNPASLGDLGFGLAGGRCCCGACTEEGEAGCPRTDCLPVTQSRSLEDHPSSFSSLCSLFPGVTSLCELRIISRFL